MEKKTGTVRALRPKDQPKYGFIKPDNGGDDLFFIPHELLNVKFADLTEGVRVSFETEHHPKGLRAIAIEALTAEVV